MELQITLELTPEIRDYAERRLAKINRHLSSFSIDSRLELSEEKTKSAEQRFISKITVAGKGTVHRAEERAEDLFTSIDKVAAVMTRQLENHKEKLHEKYRGISLARTSEEVNQVKKETFRVVKVKRFYVRPMLVNDAAKQMEELDHDFFLFFNSDADEINLIYRRKDGDYGLIEPVLE